MASENHTESPSPEEEKIVADWSAKNLNDYVGTRVINSTIGIGILGASRYYYLGESFFLGFYSHAFSAGVASITFFGTNHLLRNIREKDDSINYGISGALTGGLLFGLQNRRNGVKGLIGGAVGGVLYKFTSELVYETFRDLWIQQRRNIIETSEVKRISSRVMRIDPRGIAEGRHISYPEPEPFNPNRRK